MTLISSLFFFHFEIIGELSTRVGYKAYSNSIPSRTLNCLDDKFMNINKKLVLLNIYKS